MIRKELADRVGSIDPTEQSAALAEMDRWIDKWHGWASDMDGLKYKDNQHEKAERQEESRHLLKSTFYSDENGLVAVPDSLRDAEESIRIAYLDDSPGYPNHTDTLGGDT